MKISTQDWNTPLLVSSNVKKDTFVYRHRKRFQSSFDN